MSIKEQTTRDQMASGPGAWADRWRLAGPWWVLLLTGIAWLIISVIVLALFRGFTEIVLAFELKGAQPRLAPDRGTA